MLTEANFKSWVPSTRNVRLEDISVVKQVPNARLPLSIIVLGKLDWCFELSLNGFVIEEEGIALVRGDRCSQT